MNETYSPFLKPTQTQIQTEGRLGYKSSSMDRNLCLATFLPFVLVNIVEEYLNHHCIIHAEIKFRRVLHELVWVIKIGIGERNYQRTLQSITRFKCFPHFRDSILELLKSKNFHKHVNGKRIIL